MKQFTILGEVRPKKNSRIVNRKTGRTFPSKIYITWHNAAIEQLMIQRQGFQTTSRCKIYMKFYHGDYVKRDSDNGVSSVFDTLKDAGIIEDDNWMVIPKHFVENDYCKSSPRVEITIYEPNESVQLTF